MTTTASSSSSSSSSAAAASLPSASASASSSPPSAGTEGSGKVLGKCVCGVNVTDDVPCVEALGGVFHLGCWRCAECGTDFGETCVEGVEHKGRPYCKPCHARLFAPRCGKCGEPATGRVFCADGKTYHASCFVCDRCGQQFLSGIFNIGDKLLCAMCRTLVTASATSLRSRPDGPRRTQSEAAVAQYPGGGGVYFRPNVVPLRWQLPPKDK